MNPKDCFFAGPYTPPECVPWPKNDHEAHVIAVIWLVTWTLGLIVLFLDSRRRFRAADEHATIETEKQTAESVQARS